MANVRIIEVHPDIAVKYLHTEGHCVEAHGRIVTTFWGAGSKEKAERKVRQIAHNNHVHRQWQCMEAL